MRSLSVIFLFVVMVFIFYVSLIIASNREPSPNFLSAEKQKKMPPNESYSQEGFYLKNAENGSLTMPESAFLDRTFLVVKFGLLVTILVMAVYLITALMVR